MNRQNNNSVIDEIDELYEREEKERRVLAQLLERYTKTQGKYLATRGEMGVHHSAGGKQFRTPSFVVSHDLSWIATNLKMGSEMPFMETYLDKESGKLRIDESNVDELKQRQPDWSRQASLTAYLVGDKMRKFGTILAVISPEWVNNTQHENWGQDGRALKSAANFDPLDNEGRIGLLNLANTFVYALDGQHRVMGLRGAKDLIENNFWLMNKSQEKIRRIFREEFLNLFDLEVGSLEAMMSERMHVEYIPAVLQGETREDASRRIRSVFVAINSHAKKPTKGEAYTLDEVNGYSLVARRVGVRHPLFKGTKGSRVNWKGSALPDRSEWYTTLEALKTMAEAYLSRANPQLAKSWDPPIGLGIKEVIVRPSEDEIDLAADQMSEFLDYMLAMPVFQRLERSDDVTKELGEWRAFPDEDSPKAHGHLLLRPIGQQVLAAAVGRLINPNDKDGPRMTLSEVFESLTVLDSNGRFEAHRQENVWYGVTYDFRRNKMDVSIANQKLAVDLLVYLVRGAGENERVDLLRQVIKNREVEGSWRPFQGDGLLKVLRDEKGQIVISEVTLPLPRK